MIATLGTSVEGRPIQATMLGGREHTTVLIFGGFHGDEPKTVAIAQRLIDLLADDRSARGRTRWIVVPLVNPDGYRRRKRRNSNRIDINRNFPTKDWEVLSRRSRMFGGVKPAEEPETRAVIKAVTRYKPNRIVTLHSISGGRECNNYDGPARAMALAMSRRNGYPVKGSIGYATPGSFGTWAGKERGIPTITLELPARHSLKRCWEDNRRALIQCTGRTVAGS